MQPRHERFLIVALCAIVGWFDLWTLNSTGREWNFGIEQNDYYNLLIDGWLDGQLHLKVPVPEALNRLPDPYDPRLRPADLGLHDASFYHGKYYLYFGAAPMVVLMLPFRLLTGIDLPLAFATLVFVYGGFLASAGLWLALRRRYFANAGPATVALCLFALGVASLAPVLLRRPQMWELPIAAGYCFAMLTLGCVWRSLHAPPTARVRWCVAAGVCLGLAIASRPTYLLATPLLAAPLIGFWREDRRVPWRPAFGALLPLAGIGALMALHNYLRFGNPLEFGQAYQFSLDYESHVQHFSLRYVPFNAWRYFVSVARWSEYFPFIAPAPLPPKPPGFSGHDDVYGVLVNLPLSCVAVLAPLALTGRTGPERTRLSAWLGATAVVFAVMAGVLLCFFGSLARYEVDFTPALMLLACVGVLALERRWPRAPTRMLWRLAAVASVVFAILFSLQYDRQLERNNPREAQSIARGFNWAPFAVEKIFGVQRGGVEFDVRFRPRATGDETVATVGDPPNVTRVFVRHDSLRQMRIGVAPPDAPAFLSRAIPLEIERAHHVRIFLGALLPPATHPLFAGQSDAMIADVLRQVRVELDGEALIDERRDPTAAGGTLRLGRRALAEPAEGFTGEIQNPRTIAHVSSAVLLAFARLRISLPKTPGAACEPLVAFGSMDSARGILFVRYVNDVNHVAFGLVADGASLIESKPIAIESGRVQEITAQWSQLADENSRRLELRVDGTIAWEVKSPITPARGDPLIAGRNITSNPMCAARFTGEIHSAQLAADGRDPLLAPGDKLRLRVRFPVDQIGVRQPLLVTGRTGAGDLLLIEYLDAHHVRFAVDHWGGAMVMSEPVSIDFSAPHELIIATSSLRGPTASVPLRMTRNGAVRVELDEKLVWYTAAPAYASRPDEIEVGRNSIGGTSATQKFTGDILAAERLVR